MPIWGRRKIRESSGGVYGRTSIKQHEYMEHSTRVLFRPALFSFMKQDCVGPSKGFAAVVCSGECRLVALREIRNQGPEAVEPRVHASSVAPEATAIEQVSVINIFLATGLGMNDRTASLSNRREITARARTRPLPASPGNCRSACVRTTNGVWSRSDLPGLGRGRRGKGPNWGEKGLVTGC